MTIKELSGVGIADNWLFCQKAAPIGIHDGAYKLNPDNLSDSFQSYPGPERKAGHDFLYAVAARHIQNVTSLPGFLNQKIQLNQSA